MAVLGWSWLLEVASGCIVSDGCDSSSQTMHRIDVSRLQIRHEHGNRRNVVCKVPYVQLAHEWVPMWTECIPSHG